MNPLLAPWTGPLDTPDFSSLDASDFKPAFETAIAAHRREIDAIADNDLEPDFENTVAALERAGEQLARVRRIFWMLTSAQSSDALRDIEGDISAQLSHHGNAMAHDRKLFARIAKVFDRRHEMALTGEQVRLVEIVHRGFARGGSELSGADKARFARIDERLGQLSVQFGQNVLAATNSWTMRLDAEDLDGLPASVVSVAASRANDRGFPGKYLITLDRTDFESFLQYSARRDLRERLWRAFTSRCFAPPHDNRPIISEILSLRTELAALLGYESYAEYALEDSMAHTPEAARSLLMRLWKPALDRAGAEARIVQAMIDKDGGGFELEAWDWAYYAEKVRQDRLDVDSAVLSRSLALAPVRDAAFACAGKLYGLEFVRRPDVSVYHPSVDAWEVRRSDGAVGTLYTDYLSRPEKHGGAWMGSLRVQKKLDSDVLPIAYLVANFPPAPEGEQPRLSIGEARTLFHEFGHALHGLLSNVTYPSLAGTAVARDFVEFPSKLMEHWIVDPQTLIELGVAGNVARSLDEAALFGQGFATVELVACAIADLSLHSGKPERDPVAAVDKILGDMGLPGSIGMRHRLPYFTHVFDGGYAASYYAYLWSEMLDADAFEAFAASGNIYDPVTADRFRRDILETGNARDPSTSYLAFRGHMPSEEPLLRARGLVA